VKRTPSRIIDEAEKDWLEGFELNEIATKLNEKITTVCSWHRRRKWAQKRLNLRDKKKKLLVETLLEKYAEVSVWNLDCARILAHTALAGLDAMKRANTLLIKDNRSELFSLAQLSYLSAKIVNTTSPNCGEDLSRQMFEELKKYNETHKEKTK